MSDDIKQPDAPEGGEQASAGDPQTFPAEYVKQLREEAKQYRVQLKEMQSKMSQFEQMQAQAEESKLAEQSRWQELAEKRERELVELKSSLEKERQIALRSRIASEYKLPPQLADRLAGNTEEELKADAEALAQLIPSNPQPQAARSTTQIPAGNASTNREEFVRNWINARRGDYEAGDSETDGKTYWRFGPK